MAADESGEGTDGRGHDRLRRAASQCRNSAVRGADRGKRGLIYILTSEKFIRSLLYGSALPIVSKGVETFGVALNAFTPLNAPLPPLVWVTMLGVFVFAYWADEHTAEWREMVEETTGEEAAADDADAEEA